MYYIADNYGNIMSYNGQKFFSSESKALRFLLSVYKRFDWSVKRY